MPLVVKIYWLDLAVRLVYLNRSPIGHFLSNEEFASKLIF